MTSTPNVIEALLPDRMQVGESPLWHAFEQALYWVDIPAQRVHRWQTVSGQHQSWQMPSDAACIAPAARGGLVVAMRSGFAYLDTVSGEVSEIASAPYDTSRMRCNDGRCDAQGRFWVGTIYEPRDQAIAEMLCLERGQLRRVWSGGMTVANGLAFSPNADTLYQADTTTHIIRRYPFDLASGQVGTAQVLRQFSMDKQNNYGGRPDGAAVDSEGNYWSAMFEGSRVICLSPEGELLREIALPVRCPTMLCFGGADLKTLFITSASQNRSAQELEEYPLSGCVLQVAVDVAGRIEPSYLD